VQARAQYGALSNTRHSIFLTCDHEFRENDSSFLSPRLDWCSRLSSTDIELEILQYTGNVVKQRNICNAAINEKYEQHTQEDMRIRE
jgi:hypothetical protein